MACGDSRARPCSSFVQQHTRHLISLFFLFSSFHLCDDMSLKTSESENGIEKKNNRFDSNVDSTRPHLVCFDCCFFGGGGDKFLNPWPSCASLFVGKFEAKGSRLCRRRQLMLGCVRSEGRGARAQRFACLC